MVFLEKHYLIVATLNCKFKVTRGASKKAYTYWFSCSQFQLLGTSNPAFAMDVLAAVKVKSFDIKRHHIKFQL